MRCCRRRTDKGSGLRLAELRSDPHRFHTFCCKRIFFYPCHYYQTEKNQLQNRGRDTEREKAMQRRMERQSDGGVVTYIGRSRCWVSSAVVSPRPLPHIKAAERGSDWQSGMLDCLFALRWTTHTPTTSRCLCLSVCIPRLSLVAASLTLVRLLSARPGSVHAFPTGPNWQVCCPPSTCRSAERVC